MRWKDWERFCGVHGQKTKKLFINKALVKRELLDAVKARKLAYYGHTMRKQGSSLEKEIIKEQCQVHAGMEDHAGPGWTTSRRGQDSPWKRQSKWQTTEINGEVRPWCGQPSDQGQPKTEQNRTERAVRLKRLWTTKMKLTLFILKKCSITHGAVIFTVLKFPKVKNVH